MNDIAIDHQQRLPAKTGQRLSKTAAGAKDLLLDLQADVSFSCQKFRVLFDKIMGIDSDRLKAAAAKLSQEM
jgi:hypothetical protein